MERLILALPLGVAAGAFVLRARSVRSSARPDQHQARGLVACDKYVSRDGGYCRRCGVHFFGHLQ